MSKLGSAAKTSEFWMTIVGAGAVIAETLGVPHATELVTKYGPIVIGLVLQRVLSKTLKPGQVPFQDRAPGANN